MALSATDQNFDAEVLNYQGLVLIDFWAEWCGPCRQLGPIIDELAEELSGKVKIMKMNVDESPETPTKFAIRGIPTMILFKNGEKLDMKVGALPKAALKQWLETHIS